MSYIFPIWSSWKLTRKEKICTYTVQMVRAGSNVGRGMDHSSGLPGEGGYPVNGS